MISTGKIIRKYLNEKNISQLLLSKMLEVTPQYISNILNDLKSPSKKLLKKLVKVLGISDSDYILIEKFEIYKKSDRIYEEVKNRANYYGIYKEDGLVSKLLDKYIDTNIIDIKNVKIIEFNNKYLLFKDIDKNCVLKDDVLYLMMINNKLDILKLNIVDDMMYLVNLKNKKYIFSKKNKNIKILAINIGYFDFGGKNG